MDLPLVVFDFVGVMVLMLRKVLFLSIARFKEGPMALSIFSVSKVKMCGSYLFCVASNSSMILSASPRNLLMSTK